MLFSCSVAGAAALAGCLVAAPAEAEPGFLDPVPTFSNTVTDTSSSAAMAGDGTLVVGRDVPGVEGGLEVQVRRPGAGWGPVTFLQPASPGNDPGNLLLVGGPDGTVAATWSGGAALGPRISLLRPGARTWEQSRATGVLRSSRAFAVDPGGRLWIGGFDRTTGDNRVEVFGRAAAPTVFTVPRVGSMLDDGHVLAVGPRGTGRMVFRSEERTLEENGGVTTCTSDASLVAVDLRLGSAPTVSTIEQHHAVGSTTASPLDCQPSDGTTLGSSYVATAPDGVSTMVTASAPAGTATWTIQARKAAPGRAWPDAAQRVLPAGPRTPLDLVTVGGRVVLLIEEYDTRALSVVTRGTRGPWSSPRRLSGAVSTVSLVGGPRGGMVAWRLADSPFSVQARPVTTSGSLGRVVTIDGVDTTRLGDAVVDGHGNGGASYLLNPGGPARFLPYDGAGPRVTKTTIPKQARRGAKVRLQARAVDTWSGVRQYRWTVDGKTRTGRSVKVVFPTAGRHRVVLRVVDGRGTATVLERQVRVTAR